MKLSRFTGTERLKTGWRPNFSLAKNAKINYIGDLTAGPIPKNDFFLTLTETILT
ncbi:MAG: hypothetical protein ACT6FF_10215 [Methanosarcinaceae archaeon]